MGPVAGCSENALVTTNAADSARAMQHLRGNAPHGGVVSSSHSAAANSRAFPDADTVANASGFPACVRIASEAFVTSPRATSSG